MKNKGYADILSERVNKKQSTQQKFILVFSLIILLLSLVLLILGFSYSAFRQSKTTIGSLTFDFDSTALTLNNATNYIMQMVH